jgi:hypothetical protein
LLSVVVVVVEVSPVGVDSVVVVVFVSVSVSGLEQPTNKAPSARTIANFFIGCSPLEFPTAKQNAVNAKNSFLLYASVQNGSYQKAQTGQSFRRWGTCGNAHPDPKGNRMR